MTNRNLFMVKKDVLANQDKRVSTRKILIEKGEIVEFRFDSPKNFRTMEDKVKSLYFKYDKVNEVLKIEVGEDIYEVVEEYTWRVKYFWMTLLEW